MIFPDDEFPALFQPDVILPTQGPTPSRGAHATAYAGHARGPAESELALVARVVEQSIDDFKNCGPRGAWRAQPGSERNVAHAKDAIEAEWWLASPENRPFSFQWCCDMLGLEPDDVRRVLSITPRPIAKNSQSPRAASKPQNRTDTRSANSAGFKRALSRSRDSRLAQEIAALVHSREPESPTRS